MNDVQKVCHFNFMYTAENKTRNRSQPHCLLGIIRYQSGWRPDSGWSRDLKYRLAYAGYKRRDTQRLGASRSLRHLGATHATVRTWNLKILCNVNLHVLCMEDWTSQSAGALFSTEPEGFNYIKGTSMNMIAFWYVAIALMMEAELTFETSVYLHETTGATSQKAVISFMVCIRYHSCMQATISSEYFIPGVSQTVVRVPPVVHQPLINTTRA
jgi:hypothetical protein